MDKNSNLFIRIGHAFAGIKSAFKKESSVRVQFLMLMLLVLFCIFQNTRLIWCAIFMVISCLVICLELVNSAVEAFLDKQYPDYDVTVKYVKDCLAGAVLFASAGSILVFIFYLLERSSIKS